MDDTRIEQFRKMAEADPENELGHFSLGRAYLEVGRFDDAARSFQRVLELNDGNSKAYQLLATAQKESGARLAALVTLRKGYAVAHARGDLMPRNAMAGMMRELGEEPPDTGESPKGAPTSARTAPAGDQVRCSRCGQSNPRLPKPPFKGELGERVYGSVCSLCWREWLALGTKVINELRLDFADPQDAAIYDQHMTEFLNLV